MFDFFRKKAARSRVADARGQAIKQVLAAFERGEGIPLEASLAMHLIENSHESLTRFLIAFGGTDLWLLNKNDQRLGDPAVTQGHDDRVYVAVFSSEQRAEAAAVEWEMPNRPSLISALELVFGMNDAIGVMLNANDPYLQWIFTPEHVNNLRSLYEKSFKYEPGGIYSVWSQGSYRAAKLLKVDDGGVHIRVYANTWSERPAAIDPAELTLSAIREDSPRGVGHMPAVRKSFLNMGPSLVTTVPVIESELEGYTMWADAKGGYFGA